MALFLTSNELNSELERLLESADEQLILISPFIKLHDRYISVLRSKLHNHKLKIIIVFGKNENDFSKSMKLEDFNFLREFPNIEIRFEKRLHAKYYANDSSAILTSMNLYNFSQDNNIEAGILMKSNLFNSLSNIFIEESVDASTLRYFKRVIEQAELLFHKVPEYENTLLGLNKKYKSSKIEIDLLSDFFSKKDTAGQKVISTTKKNNYEKPLSENKRSGYCIRTGKQIPLNIKRPMSNDAFESWSKFKNPNYAEKFCHFSGESSDGKTSYTNPILAKNWEKYQEYINR